MIAGLVLAAGLALAGCGEDGGSEAAAPATAPVTATAPSPAPAGGVVLRGSVPLIDGDSLALAGLRGRVVLAVNTASRCGYTDQFAGLEELHRARRGDGLVVIGFPSDDFRQELDDDRDVAEFCRLNYGVSFRMAARTHVTGPGANALFRAIAAQPGPAGDEPSWNFTKYLIDRSGRLVARFDSSVEPDSPELDAELDRLLAKT